MTRLELIRISNLRRFGDGVEIPVGLGATIIVAPNGTGKTTLFEGLELALSRRVSRLYDEDCPLDVLVREHTNRACVELVFNDKAVIKAELARGDDDARFFGALPTEVLGSDTPIEEMHYLLRLTHLLDQSDRTWLVKVGPKAAGKILDHIPISRDVVLAKSNTTRAVRSLANRRTAAEKDVKEAEQKLDSWQRLLKKRDALRAAPSAKKARSETAIWGELLSFAKSHHLKIEDPDFQPSIRAIQQIEEKWSLSLERRLEENRRTQESLVKVSPYPARFAELKKKRQEAEIALDDLRTKQSALEKQLAESASAIEQQKASVKRAESEYQRHMQARSLLHEAEQARADVEARQALLKKAEADRADILSELKVSLAELEAGKQQLLKYKRHLKLLSEITGRKTRLQEAERLFRLWSEAEARLPELAGELARAKISLRAKNQEIEESESRLRKLREDLDAKKEHFDRLDAASSEVKQVIEIFLRTYPESTSDCPVCRQEYSSPGELRDRMSQVLEEMNPALEGATRELASANQALDGQKQHHSAQEVAKADMVSLLARLEAEQRDLDKVVEQTSSYEWFVGADLTAAAGILEKAAAEAELDDSRLESMAIPREVQESEIRELQDSANAIQESLSQVIEPAVRSAAAQLEEARSLLSITTKLFKEEKFPAEGDLEEQIAELLKVYNQRSENLKVLEQSQVDLRKEQESLKGEIRQANGDLGSIKNSIEELQSVWQSQDLQGEPEKLQLVDAENRLELREQKTRKALALLDEMRAEANSLESSRLLEDAQRSVDEMSGSVDEREFSDQLNAEAQAAKRHYEQVSSAHERATQFSHLLNKRIEEREEEIGNISSTWQQLLRQIVRQDRYAETELTSEMRYNVSQGQILAPLAGLDGQENRVGARFLASEAQLTDLQLTFVLAMSLRRKWSTWKGLLLDDPTQHHDLVHASSVFDVLRSFITDHQYQLILATHDMQQAQFLANKVRHYSVPARIWRLGEQEGQDGVGAQEVEY